MLSNEENSYYAWTTRFWQKKLAHHVNVLEWEAKKYHGKMSAEGLRAIMCDPIAELKNTIFTKLYTNFCI